MSTGLTGLVFLLGLIISTLGIVLFAVSGLPTYVIPVFWFIGLLLFGWALLSFALNPDLEDYQRNVAFFFLVLLVAFLFGYGLAFKVVFM